MNDNGEITDRHEKTSYFEQELEINLKQLLDRIEQNYSLSYGLGQIEDGFEGPVGYESYDKNGIKATFNIFTLYDGGYCVAVVYNAGADTLTEGDNYATADAVFNSIPGYLEQLDEIAKQQQDEDE